MQVLTTTPLSPQVKLAAALLLLNEHSSCIGAARAARALEPSLNAAVAPVEQLCERARKEGMDTSQVHIDLAL
jgi:hypothetical protein